MSTEIHIPMINVMWNISRLSQQIKKKVLYAGNGLDKLYFIIQYNTILYPCQYTRKIKSKHNGLNQIYSTIQITNIK